MARARITINKGGISTGTDGTKRKRGRPFGKGNNAGGGVSGISDGAKESQAFPEESPSVQDAEIIGDIWNDPSVAIPDATGPELVDPVHIESKPRRRKTKTKAAVSKSGDTAGAVPMIIGLLNTVGMAVSDQGAVTELEAGLIATGIENLPGERFAAAMEKLYPVALLFGIGSWGFRTFTNRRQTYTSDSVPVTPSNPHVKVEPELQTQHVDVNPFAKETNPNGFVGSSFDLGK